MQNYRSQESAELEEPFPLRRYFLLFILPVMCVALLGLLVAFGSAISSSMERAYISEASVRHKLLLSVAEAAAPEAFRQSFGNQPSSTRDRQKIIKALSSEIDELGITCAAILTVDGSVISEGGRIPCARLAPTDLEDLNTPGAEFLQEESDQPVTWVVATSIAGPADHRPLIVVSRNLASSAESSAQLYAMIWVGGLAALFVFFVAATVPLVMRAQKDIDRRTSALNEARRAIARFVSAQTRDKASRGSFEARQICTTVLFMDIRDFSSFADSVPPEDAADLVSELAGIGFSAVRANRGDVDRLLGDGLMARFDGDDRYRNAWKAAAAIQTQVSNLHRARGVGISLHDGDVVEAVIAASDRADSTILGRTVNIGARLCAAAGRDEILASSAIPPPPDELRLMKTGEESLTLKGHSRSLIARRYRVNASQTISGVGLM